jgi:hypothetical protein
MSKGDFDLEFKPPSYWDDGSDSTPRVIASVTLCSVHGETWSVIATQVNGCIQYRVSDGEVEFDIKEEPPSRVLSLLELTQLMDSTNYPYEESHLNGVVQSHWEHMYEMEGDWNSAPDFAQVSSAFYPDLAEYYAYRARLWRVEKWRQRNAETKLAELESQRRIEKLEPFESAIKKMVATEAKNWSKPRSGMAAWGQSKKRAALRQSIEDYVIENGELPSECP